MDKEYFTRNQAICTFFLFIFGSTAIMGVNSDAKQDSWISMIIALLFSLPFIYVYARIIKLYPEKGLFEILETVFGKVAGKILTLLMTWYAIHLGALVLRNFSEFIQVASMPETPQLPLMISIVLVALYLAKSGIKTYGKWGVISFIIIITVVLLTVVLSLSFMDLDNIMPIMGQDYEVIGKGAFKLLTFPFLESVLFLGLAEHIKKEDSPNKIYFITIIISGLVFLVIVLRNIEVLGSEFASSVYFPSYIEARIIKIGTFLTRIEGSISINFILGGITKITLCTIVAAKGLKSLLGFNDYKRIILPVSFIMLSICAIVYTNIMQMFAFINIYQFYAIPFEIIIPLAVWITAEIKNRHNKNKNYLLNTDSY